VLRLTDSLSIMSVTLTLPRPCAVSVAPLFADARSAGEFSLSFGDSVVVIGRLRGGDLQVSGPRVAVSLTHGVPRREEHT